MPFSVKITPLNRYYFLSQIRLVWRIRPSAGTGNWICQFNHKDRTVLIRSTLGMEMCNYRIDANTSRVSVCYDYHAGHIA